MVLDIELKIVSGPGSNLVTTFGINIERAARIIIGCEQLFPLMEPLSPLRDNGNGTPGHPDDISVTGDHWSVRANPGPLIGQATEVYALLKSCVNAIPSRSNDDSPCQCLG